MDNPFKFGTVVDGKYFTDRTLELSVLQETLHSENHIVLISPRRFGKTSLVYKALSATPRRHIVINMQSVTSVQNFAVRLTEAVFKLFPMERLRHLLAHFRVVPTVSSNPVTGQFDVSFMPTASSDVVLEDTMALLERATDDDNRLIVVLDEFQEVNPIGKGFDRQLRALMQTQHHINYVFLGSQESMMEQIFEKKKSPFYHFGQLMRLGKIPYDDFRRYLMAHLPGDLADGVLAFTRCHPYYTQQLAFHVWNLVNYEHAEGDIVKLAIERLVMIHDLDFERLWVNFNRQDRRILQDLARQDGVNPMKDRAVATSTTYSGLKRLMGQGYVIKTDAYEIEDPFFRMWIAKM